MRKITIALFSGLLYTGCSTVERNEEDCIKWNSIQTPREECTGGRGVAPVMCVTKWYTKPFCVRWLPDSQVAQVPTG